MCQGFQVKGTLEFTLGFGQSEVTNCCVGRTATLSKAIYYISHKLKEALGSAWGSCKLVKEDVLEPLGCQKDLAVL